MEDTRNGVEDAQFLAGSPLRLRILGLLLERGVAEKRELRAEIDASRTTIQRNLVALEEERLIKEVENSTYSHTPIGELVIEEFSNLLDTLELARQWKPLVRWLPAEDGNLDPRVFESAEIVLASEHDPYATVNRHVEAVQSAESIRALLPQIGKQAAETAGRRVNGGELQVEIVFEQSTFDALLEDPHYADALETHIRSPGGAVLAYPGRIPYYLGLIDDLVQVGFADEEGIPRAMVESDAPEARAWAERTYERFRSRSTEAT